MALRRKETRTYFESAQNEQWKLRVEILKLQCGSSTMASNALPPLGKLNNTGEVNGGKNRHEWLSRKSGIRAEEHYHTGLQPTWAAVLKILLLLSRP